jgi:hypothetical protein
MDDLRFAVRLIHVAAGVGWLGEVATINFVLLPALFKARADERTTLLTTVFPYLFRLATVLGGATMVTGMTLLVWYTHLQPDLLLHGRWDHFVLAGGTLGAALYAFHLVQESGAERSLAAHLAFAIDSDDPRATAMLLRRLAIFPRAGMLVLATVVSLMVAAAHLP